MSELQTFLLGIVTGVLLAFVLIEITLIKLLLTV